jgi:hypothetical protein
MERASYRFVEIIHMRYNALHYASLCLGYSSRLDVEVIYFSGTSVDLTGLRCIVSHKTHSCL